MEEKKIREDILYPELSYEIIGCAFEVFNELGPGHLERTYERAMAVGFIKRGIKFKEQVYYPIKFEGETVGNNYFDFFVDDKVIVELKCGTHFTRANFQQVHKYLAVSGKKLAILITFTKDGVIQKRVVNDY
ncbi:MAG: GxxExxY protein [Candidatus Uhrbacteria bacterium]